MTNVYSEFEDELELEGELEGFLGEEELEDEFEMEAEDELEGEFEDEFEDELRSEFEDEDEFEVEAFAGSVLGEEEFEDEYEVEAEAEEFFKVLKKLPWKKLLKVAGPLVATAVGGPAAGAVARAVTSQLEGEFEDELEAELEEMASAPINSHQALGEYLAARAAESESESEAEGFVGSAVTLTLRRGEYRDLQRMLPSMIRGSAALARVLRQSRGGRPAVRLIPGIVDASARTLARRQAAGTPVRRADLGAALSASTRRALADPRWQRSMAYRHARGLGDVRRRQGQMGRPSGSLDGRGYATTIRRNPSRTRTATPQARLNRPRPGFVRVSTPVRVPARGGQPSKTVRVVSDVRVPTGARLVGRPVGVTGGR